MDKGADQQKIVRALYKTQPLHLLKLWGRVMAQVKWDENLKLIWAFVTIEDLVQARARVDDLPAVLEKIKGNYSSAHLYMILYPELSGVVRGIDQGAFGRSARVFRRTLQRGCRAREYDHFRHSCRKSRGGGARHPEPPAEHPRSPGDILRRNQKIRTAAEAALLARSGAFSLPKGAGLEYNGAANKKQTYGESRSQESRRQSHERRAIAGILKKMREASIEEQASMLAAANGLPYIDLHVFPAGTEDVLLVPETDARGSVWRSSTSRCCSSASPSSTRATGSARLYQGSHGTAWVAGESLYRLGAGASARLEKLLQTHLHRQSRPRARIAAGTATWKNSRRISASWYR